MLDRLARLLLAIAVVLFLIGIALVVLFKGVSGVVFDDE